MGSAPARILVVDDELPIRTTLSALLQRRGYEVTVAANGEEALDLIHQRPFDLLLLDLKMPGLSGMDVAHRARELHPDAAILILTGHGSLESALDGLRLGVFDYMLKTASPQEVLERVTTALATQEEQRRHQQLMRTLHAVVGELGGGTTQESPPPASTDNWIEVGDLKLSTWNQTVRLGDRMLNLTPTEFRILVSLAQRAGHVVTYQELVQQGQGYAAESYAAAELIKPHIYHLRQKIEPDPGDPRYILTVRGTGYMLATNSTPPAE